MGTGGPPATSAQIDDLILWITLGIIAGGRLGYLLFYMLPLAAGRAELAAHPLEAFELWHGGMSFHGGAIGVTLAIVAVRDPAATCRCCRWPTSPPP